MILGAARPRPYAAELGDDPRRRTLKGAELVGRSYVPLFPFFADHRDVVPGPRRRLRRRPRRARASCTSPPASVRTTSGSCDASRHPSWWSRWTRPAGSPTTCPTRRASTCSTPTPTSSATSRSRAGPAPRDDTCTTIRTAGAPTRRSSTGRCRRWYVGSPSSTIGCSRQRADQLDPRPHQARRVRQVARGRPRLVDQPQPVLGLADPGVAERRSRVPPRGRLRLARRDRARLRRSVRPTCTVPRSTS